MNKAEAKRKACQFAWSALVDLLTDPATGYFDGSTPQEETLVREAMIELRNEMRRRSKPQQHRKRPPSLQEAVIMAYREISRLKQENEP